MRAALGFLTILPVGRGQVGIGGRGILLAFPLAGLVVGFGWAAAGVVGLRWWSPFVAAGLVLCIDLLLTGGLHVDAVADVGDAVASRRPPDTVREVLSDPRVGGVGAGLLVVVLLLRFASLAAVIESSTLALIAVPVVGRAGMVAALGAMPASRGSLASDLVEPARGGAWIVAAVMALLVTTGLALPAFGVLRGVVAAVAGVGTAGIIGAGWRVRYGFASGDAVGAAGLVGETVALLALSS